MKKIVLLVLCVNVVAFTACSTSKGCPSNGRNLGAERVNDAINGDKKAQKLLKKAGKFRH